MSVHVCLECRAVKDCTAHHVVPRSRGGTKTVWLCRRCHSLAHKDYKKTNDCEKGSAP